ncbi:MAG TPA: nucleotidyltransferase domain-containing protein [Gemmatimonadales bacterium]|nr:nucleotidyltransferase domain-containing protein [Gemmatimonadales bacterium]
MILRTGLGPQPMYVLNSHSALVRHALLPLFRGCRPADEPGDGERGAIAELFATLQEAVEVPDGACVEWAVLFGSTANRTDTSRSDIDFGVIVTDEPDLERMRTRLAEMLPTVRRRFGRLLSPVVMTLDQARGLATAGHPLLDAIAAGRVILARHPTLREVLHRKD